MYCINCQTETLNPKFCSRSCAASFNNKIKPKREGKKRCKICNALTNSRSFYCNEHKPFLDLSKLTKKDFQGKRKYQISSQIRELARNIYRKSDKPKYCINCGYNKHYEICHIHAIQSFSVDTPLSEINSLDNLIALCPNCHWELDNGLLTI